MADLAASDADNLQARLDALHASGADRHDPIRFAYLAALARRAVSQPEAIRQPLIAKITALADELAARQAAPPAEIAEEADDKSSPLANLLAYIGRQAHQQPETSQSTSRPRPAPAPPRTGTRQGPELKSVAYFRNTWSKLSTEQQLTQTLAQAPENAGPMNSQHLVLRSLQVMRDISPDYLQGFMSYIDALIWLDHADPGRPSPSRPSGGEGEKKRKLKKG